MCQEPITPEENQPELNDRTESELSAEVPENAPEAEAAEPVTEAETEPETGPETDGDDETLSSECLPAGPPQPLRIADRRPGARRTAVVSLCLCGLILVAAVLYLIFGADSRSGGNEADGAAGMDMPDSYHGYFETLHNTNLLLGQGGMLTAGTGIGSGLTLPVEPIAQDTPTLSYQQVYEQVNPAVVGVDAYVSNGQSWGTGVLISPDGYIVTNTHIIAGAYSLMVTLADGREYVGFLVGSDTDSDLAVLKIYGETDFPWVAFGDSEALHVGDEVVAIGNPLGSQLRGTMTNGIISAISRDVTHDGRTMTLLQTNAALNEGNSGGALVNLYGQVVGITNMKIANSRASSINVEGIGFAIPTSTVQQIANTLLEQGYIPGSTALGISVYKVTDELAAYYSIPAGIYVMEVRDGAPAGEQGLEPGDIITHVNGERVTSVDEVAKAKQALAVGDMVSVTVYRDGAELELEVTLVDAGIY